MTNKPQDCIGGDNGKIDFRKDDAGREAVRDFIEKVEQMVKTYSEQYPYLSETKAIGLIFKAVKKELGYE